MTQFPFTAIVGSDDLALALTLTAISPEVGGVLVRGEKGTAKSTMVRALAALLPAVDVVEGCRFSCDPASPDPECPDGPHRDATALTRPARLVELPVGATEDRVIGSLHLERALSAGVAEYEPGLLAAAHRGLLYVDEVNLLHDHLVDLLLDAAAMGRSTVEREGVSVAHAARFVLVGTMNPEEGELRPQLLDRFGLTVEVSAPRDPGLRVEVIRRRMAYDAAPESFAAGYAAQEQALAQRIADAREALADVKLGEEALLKIAEVCAAFEVDGMRADIITARTAVAHAALAGRDEVTRADIRAAARLAIPHRRRRNPFEAPGLDEGLLDALLGEEDPEPTDPNDDEPARGDESAVADTDASSSASATHHDDAAGTSPMGSNSTPEGASTADVGEEPQAPSASGAGGTTPSAVAQARSTYRTRLFKVAGIGEGEAGRRSRAITSTGRTIGATTNPGSGIHLPATIRAAAPHQQSRAREDRLVLKTQDLRRPIREGRESNLVLFCVDASGSMAARKRMEQVKAAALSLLLDAYQRRDKVGLITFRGAAAELVLPPTSSVDVAALRLKDLATGGRTPLPEGLLTAMETLRLERIRDPRRRALLVVVTDGRATSGPDAIARSTRIAQHIADQGIATLVVDCETGRFRLGLAAQLALHLNAEYVPLGEVSAAALTDTIRTTRKAA